MRLAALTQPGCQMSAIAHRTRFLKLVCESALCERFSKESVRCDSNGQLLAMGELLISFTERFFRMGIYWLNLTRMFWSVVITSQCLKGNGLQCVSCCVRCQHDRLG